MKNIYLIPTDKPSRLGRFIDTLELILRSSKDIPRGENVSIYITSDEEIKEGDYVFVNCSEIEIEEVRLVTGYYNEQFLFDDKGQIHIDYCKKIVLSTDPDLIVDGVQAIDDDFLHWFVKNSNCEVATLEKEHDDTVPYPKMRFIKPYKIIIPQEETKQSTVGKEFYESNDEIITVYKQETLEEAALNYSIYNEQINKAIQEAVKFGSKWMEKRMYSEEEVKLLLDKVLIDHSDIVLADIPEWFENNKKN